ncbi:MAG: hypothetical protein WCI88_14140 [Chloroflexota bacterium]
MTPLEIFLKGITHLGIDTAPFIYFVERNLTYLDTLLFIFNQIDTGVITGYSSVITLTEVLTMPKKAGMTSIENAYRDLLIYSRNFNLISIDAHIAVTAADL